MKKYPLILFFIVGIGTGIPLGWIGGTIVQKSSSVVKVINSPEEIVLPPIIETLLAQKITLLEELAQNATIVSEAQIATAKNRSLSESEIKSLDTKWQTAKEGDPFVSQFLTNKVAIVLKEFQKKNSSFVEVFVSDGVGLNFGGTEKTSDYFQADEAWWVDAYNEGSGKKYHGKIEYDDSARSESIAVYVPIYSKQKVVIGIIKAVLDITGFALQEE